MVFAASTRLPPFSALRALEAAVRHRSYSRAAEALFVTHGAVSHQIRRLEEEFGVRLFRRDGARMTPTPAAERLAAKVAEATQLLDQGVARLRSEGAADVLVVSTLAGMARRMLTGRLGRFADLNPGVEIEVRAEERLADFLTDGVDLALRYGAPPWPGVEADELFRETLYPVCSPAFLERHDIRTQEDLTRVPLLRQRHRAWALWFDSVGLEADEPTGGLVFDDSDLLLDAAAEGLGVALARGRLAEPDLAEGRLVRPFPEEVKAQWGYYTVWRADSPKRTLIERFRDWLKAELTDPLADSPAGQAKGVLELA